MQMLGIKGKQSIQILEFPFWNQVNNNVYPGKSSEPLFVIILQEINFVFDNIEWNKPER